MRESLTTSLSKRKRYGCFWADQQLLLLLVASAGAIVIHGSRSGVGAEERRSQCYCWTRIIVAATGLRIATKLLLCGGICGEATTVERLGVAARVVVTKKRKDMQLLLVHAMFAGLGSWCSWLELVSPWLLWKEMSSWLLLKGCDDLKALSDLLQAGKNREKYCYSLAWQI
ncbi:hypothetical protein OIU79_001889 [Salix purpurea]|uniref:Uncharacterized protein n=1 Tax=Salix purpurea TaxID=77065 RepID=A0A9Q0URT6_SALPP|nr:hypothetical protein OIU79_001889 [Salix purpurea]